MKQVLLAWLLLLASADLAMADIITQWTFEGDTSSPSTGTGIASLIGGTSSTFANGNGGGRGWNTSTYASQSTESGQRGVQFQASTIGFESISVSFDHRASGTSSRWAQVDYTLDGGGNWVTGFWNNAGGLSPHDTFYSFNVDFSSVTGASNNADFGFRIVSIFSPQAFDQNSPLGDFAANTAYMRANAQASFTSGGGTGTGDYGTAGTWRFDNMTVSGSTAAVPEPGTFGILALMVAVGFVLRRQGRGKNPKGVPAAG